ncbi:MAG: hypothetical protein GY756_06070 [bacterium]|nr:hypothetical protein [bacterium]
MSLSNLFGENIKQKVNICILIFIALLIYGCSSQQNVYIGRQNWVGEMSSSALTTGEISYLSKQFLLSNGLEHDFVQNPDKVLKLMITKINGNPSFFVTPNDNVRDTINVLIDLTMYRARQMDEDAAIKYWTTCSYYSYYSLFSKKLKPTHMADFYLTQAAALRYYNIATSEVLSYIIKNKIKLKSHPVLPCIVGKIKFQKLKSDLKWPPDSFKDFIICYDYLPKNFKSHTFSSGIGVPVIGENDVSSEIVNPDEFTLLHSVYPFTFLIEYSLDNPDNIIEATPEAYDSFNDEFVTINKERIPLAKDFTIVLGKVLETEKRIDGLTWLRHSDKNEQLQGIYLISPYDPDKIPVVLVHGLMSEPRTWGKLLNILLNNRKIRKNYEFWIYACPTGIPIPINAYRFRKSLERLKKKFDPTGTNKKINDMVIIGHSMGGLLTRLSVQNSKGTELLESVLDAKIDKMKFTVGEREELMDIGVWEALPFVKRVILISTPNRGADMAITWYSKLGARFVRIPKDVKDLSADVIDKITRKNENIINKNKQFNEYAPTGIGGLSPHNKFLKESVKMPIADNVKVHSIIGDTAEDSRKNGTDGIVPYWSSHLDDANSEIVIKSDHGAHTRHKATKEIIRILNEHIK